MLMVAARELGRQGLTSSGEDGGGGDGRALSDDGDNSDGDGEGRRRRQHWEAPVIAIPMEVVAQPRSNGRRRKAAATKVRPSVVVWQMPRNEEEGGAATLGIWKREEGRRE